MSLSQPTTEPGGAPPAGAPPPPAHPHRRPHQALPRHRLPGRRRAQPDGQPRRDLRPARPQRGRQDDDRGHAHDPRDPHLGPGVRRRHRRRPATRRWPSSCMGMVSQQNTLDRQLSCWENLYFHGRLFGMSSKECRAVADDLLEKFHLSKWGKASVYALSGGMAQRLMVARSIFHRPAVLFMDEPTAGPRPAEPPGPVGDPHRAQRRGSDHPAHHPLHGGSRSALQPGGDHGPRPDPGPRHAPRRSSSRSAPTPS